jgi:hypothetical protein
LEFVGIQQVEIGNIDGAVRIEISLAPVRRRQKLVAIPNAEVRGVHHSIEIRVADGKSTIDRGVTRFG